MNKRIRELADQCRFETYGINCELLEVGFNEEKFAELLIQECIAAATDELVSQELINATEAPADQYYLNGCNDGIVDAVVSIKQHFGIQ